VSWIGLGLVLAAIYLLWRLFHAAPIRRAGLALPVPKNTYPASRCVHLPSPESPFQLITLLVPEFPLQGAAIQMIKSLDYEVAREQRAEYEINLSLLACTCPDFVKRRSGFAGRDARRICKHLYHKIRPVSVRLFDPLLQVFLSEHQPSPYLYQATMGGDNIVLFGITPGDEWLNVFTRRRHKGEMPGSFTGEYKRYGFSIARNGWAYGDRPAGADELRQLIAYFVSD